MALQFLTIAFNQLLEWKISPLHKYDINIIIPPPSRRPILLREYIWCSKDGNQSDFSCSPTYLCFSLTDWLLPSTHSHATPSPRLDTGARASRRAHSHTDTQREARHSIWCWLRALCVQGVAAAGIFTALIININSQARIHPLPDLRDCSICMTLSL